MEDWVNEVYNQRVKELKDLLHDSKTCPYCESPIQQMEGECPNCGRPLSLQAKYELEELISNVESLFRQRKLQPDNSGFKRLLDMALQAITKVYGSNPRVQQLVSMVESETAEI